MSYIGSKSRISKWILPKIPTDITTYCEPFGGMMWNYLKMDLTKYPNLKTVVYNDFNQLNSNLFRCARNYHIMKNMLDYYQCQQYGEYPTPPKYAEQFYRFQKEIFNPSFKLTDEPNYDVAFKYVYVVQNCYSGLNPATAKFVDLKGKYHCKVKSFIKKMKDKTYQEHLDRISFVENMDFEQVILKYDSPTSFFYLDPPYQGFEYLYSNHSFFGIDQHFRLAELLENIMGRFALSYYRFPELDKMYPEDFFTYFEKEFTKSAITAKGKKQKTANELLIVNY